MKQQLRNFLLVSCLLFSAVSHAQISTQNAEDVVYLKNGSIIHGIIIEQILGKSLKIQTHDGNVFVYSYEEVAKLTKENLPSAKTKKDWSYSAVKQRGYFSIVEINYMPGARSIKIYGYSAPNSDYSFGLNYVNGYRFNDRYSLGIGVAVERHDHGTFLPLTLDARVKILKGSTSPTINARIGHVYGTGGELGGFTANPSIGIKRQLSKKISYLFDIGYKWQQYEGFVTITDYTGYSNTFTKKVFAQYLTLSTGISF